jgi:hypothetical protein
MVGRAKQELARSDWSSRAFICIFPLGNTYSAAITIFAFLLLNSVIYFGKGQCLQNLVRSRFFVLGKQNCIEIKCLVNEKIHGMPDKDLCHSIFSKCRATGLPLTTIFRSIKISEISVSLFCDVYVRMQKCCSASSLYYNTKDTNITVLLYSYGGGKS